MANTNTQNEARACECSRFEAVTNPAEPDEAGRDTGCTRTTVHTFAPGHDAKLKSLLIWAGVNGAEVREHQGGVDVVSDAETIAKQFGFESQVVAGIARGQAKAEAKHAKQLARSAQKLTRASKKAKTNGTDADNAFAEALAEAKAEVVTSREKYPERVTAKIGRWEYEGYVAADGTFSYTDKSGQGKSTTKYTLVGG